MGEWQYQPHLGSSLQFCMSVYPSISFHPCRWVLIWLLLVAYSWCSRNSGVSYCHWWKYNEQSQSTKSACVLDTGCHLDSKNHIVGEQERGCLLTSHGLFHRGKSRALDLQTYWIYCASHLSFFSSPQLILFVYFGAISGDTQWLLLALSSGIIPNSIMSKENALPTVLLIRPLSY